MIARDHDGLDPGALATCNRIPDFGPRRILQADETNQRKTLFDIGRHVSGYRLRERPFRQREHAQGIARQ